MDKLPNDPFMLLSTVNMYLRDRYDTLDDMCDDLGVDKDELVRRLAEAGFDYMPQIRQFR